MLFKKSKLLLVPSLVSLMLVALMSTLAMAADLSPREIMEKVDDRYTGDTSVQDSTMILIDRKGKQRVRQTKAYSKEYGDDSKSISFFLSPADVKNTSFLSHTWDDESKEDDSWLYLPALRKVKRIASSDKSGAFMGSDFTYYDIEQDRDLDKFDYKMLKDSEMVDGHDTWVIESKPKKKFKKKEVKKSGYLKSNFWVRKDNFLVIKGKFWVKKGKKIKYMSLKDVEEIQGVWTAKTLQMVTTKKKKTEHSTVLQLNSVTYNEPLEDDMFTTQRMERGL